MPSEDDHVLIQGVAGDHYSLGFVGLAYYKENSERIRLVPVDNGEGPVYPNEQTIMTNRYKPLTRTIFIYVSKEIIKAERGIEFVTYYLENAGRLAGDVGYIPLSDENYQEQLTRFKNFVTPEPTIN